MLSLAARVYYQTDGKQYFKLELPKHIIKCQLQLVALLNIVQARFSVWHYTCCNTAYFYQLLLYIRYTIFRCDLPLLLRVHRYNMRVCMHELVHAIRINIKTLKFVRIIRDVSRV